MTLAPGTRLGPYEILGQIGAGGMGEVYRGRDGRLGREVAIKVLPAALSSDPERLKRFEKEARSASSLNHPNIVTVYDIGESGGVAFLAMELLDGQTVRELLAEGAAPTKRLLAIAAQVGDGLSKAHAAGIVHRDLKPENIMVTKDGFAKILDFGLAKLTQPEGPVGATQTPTLSGATEPGMVMGTIGYMSPEQVLGRALDFRSDQFSFGSILHEMATGRRAFARASAPETLTAILRDEPEPIASLAPQTPPPLVWIVERCLAKNPDDRYASTRDLAHDLAKLRERAGEMTSGAAASVAPAAGPRRLFTALPWALAAGVVVAAAALWSSGRKPAAALPVRFAVVMPDGVAFENGDIEGHSAISPDGRKLAFVGDAGGRRRLYLRTLESLETRALEGTDGAISPFWSPDSRSLGFFADGKLLRMDLSGGPPRLICPQAPHLESLPSWGSAGEILFAQLDPEKPGIYAVRAEGGPSRRLIYSGQKENFGVWPMFLPDGRRFLYLFRDFDLAADRRWYWRAGSLDSDKTTLITDRIPSRVEYVRQGYLVFGRQGTLLAQAFDQKTLRLSGEPLTLAEHVYYFNGPAMTGFSASQEGVIAYEKGARPSRLAWLDRGGREIQTIPLTGVVGGVRLSPDGRTIAASLQDERSGTSDIWLYDLARRLPLRLTLDEGDDRAPVWSPDGTKVYFRGDRAGPPDLFEVPVTSPGRDRLILQRPGVQHPEDVSPDGRFLIFTEWTNGRMNGDLWLMPLSKGGVPVALEESPFYEAHARFSPDGHWIAFVSNESGAREVYLRPAGASGERIRVSSWGGSMPRWRRDGRELFYLSAASDVMAVPIGPGSKTEPGSAVALFRLEGEVRDYDVDLSGQRFLADTAPSEPAPMAVLVNWQALLPK